MGSTTIRRALPLVAAVMVAVGPFVIADRFLLKVFTYVGINVLVVTGIALLFGYAGQVSLGNAAFVGIGAYTCAFLTVRMQVPWVFAFATAGAVSHCCSGSSGRSLFVSSWVRSAIRSSWIDKTGAL